MMILPFKFTSWDPQDTFIFTFYEVEFTQDFGWFTEGEHYSCVEIDYQTGTLTAFGQDGAHVIHKQDFGMIAQ